jgi:hypothetical protein
MTSALAISLVGCATGDIPEDATHLRATQCSDLAALRNNAPVTPERNRSELAEVLRVYRGANLAVTLSSS